jgi:hypothetical protein
LTTIPVGPASASIMQLPAVQITADGSVIPIADQPRLGTDGLWHFDFRFESNDYSLHAFFTGDPDPSLSYGITVVDFGAPSSFGFLFGTPIVLSAGPNVVASSLSGILTDGGLDGVSATGLSQVSDVGMPITNMGVDLSGPCSGAGCAFAAGPIPGPPGPWTFLTVTTFFGLSGEGDQAQFTGSASIDPAARVPEPTTALLLCAGLGFAAWRRRRALSDRLGARNNR